MCKVNIMRILLVSFCLSVGYVFGQDYDKVVVKLSDIERSYNKMRDLKVLQAYTDSLEVELANLTNRVELLNEKISEQKKIHEELVKVKDDKYKTLEKLIKRKKLQFISGFGGNTNSDFNIIQLNLNVGLMFKQKRIITISVGMDNRQNFLFGGQFYIVLYD